MLPRHLLHRQATAATATARGMVRLSAPSASMSTSAARRQASPAPEQPKMIKLTIDGKEVEVVQG